MELSIDSQLGPNIDGSITVDAIAPFEQGMKKLTNAYSTFFN